MARTTYHPVDVHVGWRLRQIRTARGLTFETLAAEADLSVRQIQKYETGRNRISASRLYQFAELLDTDVGYFFQGIRQ